MRSFLVTCILALFCNYPLFAKPTPVKEDSLLDIASIFNLSGEQKPLDEASYQGAKLAVFQINQKGGLLGQKIRLTNYDGKSNLKLLTILAENLAADPKIKLVVGLNDNDTLMAVAPVILNQNKIFISPGATSPLFNALFSRQLFLVSFTDKQQGTKGAQYAYETLQARNVAILFDNQMFYALTLSAYFSAKFKTLGGKIKFVLTLPKTEVEERKFSSQLKSLMKQHAISFIYLAANPTDVPKYIQQLKRLHYKGIIMGGDSYVPEEIIKASRKKMTNIYFTALRIMKNSTFPISQEQAVITENFLTQYNKMYPKESPTVNAALGYDAINLLAQGIKLAKSTNPLKIQKALRAFKQPFLGVTGVLSYTNDFVNFPNRTVSIYTIKDNVVSLVSSKP